MINRKGLLVLLALLCLFALPFASALDTNLIIKTKRPNTGIVVRIVNPDNHDDLYGSAYGTTEPTGVGEVSVSTIHTDLAFLVLLVKGGKVKDEKLFEGPYTIQPEIELYFYDPSNETTEETSTDSSQDSSNETDNTSADAGTGNDSPSNSSNETSDITTNEGDTSNPITGNVISPDGFEIPSFSYYIIAAVVLAGIIGMFLLRKFRSVNGNKEEKYTPPGTSEFTGSSTQAQSQALADAKEELQKSLLRPSGKGAERDEKRIQNLQREIELLKKKEQLRKAEEEYVETERELKKLHHVQKEDRSQDKKEKKN